MRESNETRFRFGPFDLDLMRGALQDVDGNEIKLRPKSFQLLSYFIVNSGRLISKVELINQLWSNTIVGDDSLAQCVSELRTAIRDGSYWVPGWWEEVWVACLQDLCDSRRGRREPATLREDPRIWRYRGWAPSPRRSGKPKSSASFATIPWRRGVSVPPAAAGAPAPTALFI